MSLKWIGPRVVRARAGLQRSELPAYPRARCDSPQPNERLRTLRFLLVSAEERVELDNLAPQAFAFLAGQPLAPHPKSLRAKLYLALGSVAQVQRPGRVPRLPAGGTDQDQIVAVSDVAHHDGVAAPGLAPGRSYNENRRPCTRSTPRPFRRRYSHGCTRFMILNIQRT